MGAEVFLSGCSKPEAPANLFSDDLVLLLDEIGETVLPETDQSPGAKTALIGAFMKSIVEDCYDEQERKIFIQGVNEVASVAQEKYQNSFINLSPDEKLALLTQFDREAHEESANGQVHFFTMIKQLTIWGYFSSETGATKALRFNPVPGRYQGCLPYQPGEPAWT